MRYQLIVIPVVSIFLLTCPVARAQVSPERSQCERCWYVYEGNIRMGKKYAAMASERSNGTAGGGTAGWWNSYIQGNFDSIRKCCTDDEMGERCDQFEDVPIQQMWLRILLVLCTPWRWMMPILTIRPALP